jgi:hypothetical protein
MIIFVGTNQGLRRRHCRRRARTENISVSGLLCCAAGASPLCLFTQRHILPTLYLKCNPSAPGGSGRIFVKGIKCCREIIHRHHYLLPSRTYKRSARFNAHRSFFTHFQTGPGLPNHVSRCHNATQSDIKTELDSNS